MAANHETLVADPQEDSQPAKRKRLRIPKSCIPCLKGKRACDRNRPACGRCTRSNQAADCTYDSRLADSSLGQSSRQNVKAEYDSDEDDETERRGRYESLHITRLQHELQEARNEAQRLRIQLATQSREASFASAAQPTTPVNRSRTYSNSHDLHAARGLQMLAEIAGPNLQDASANAGKAGILHWTSRKPNASSTPSSTQLSPNAPGYSSSSGAQTRSAHSLPSSTAGITPSDRPWQSPSSENITRHAHLGHKGESGPDGDSPKNINGTQIYYGEHPSDEPFLRVMAGGTASSGTDGPGSGATAPNNGPSVRKDIQSAFNSLLDPSHDTFPFATIWSSGTAFFDEVMPFFPSHEDFNSICASFVRHFSAMCPALTMPTAINHARAFSRMTREEKGQVSLPWLAVFLMICALGKNCDLDSTTDGVDKKVRMLDAFLSSDASRQPSRASSPRLSSSETASSAKAAALKSPAMVSDLFLSAAYQSLRLCSFLSSPTLQTIHAQLLIGSYLLNTERAASFWPLLGSVARQAQSIGLHVDPYIIKADWDPVEADIRRRLWWAVVHQDVILSGIFGRPLGVTRFSCKFPCGTDPNRRNYAMLQCEFSQLARIYLDENQDRSWSQRQVTAYTEKVLQWYMDIPSQYRPHLGRLDIFGSETESEVVQNYTAAGVDLNQKGLLEVHQSGNLAVEVFYILLTLHRANLFPLSSAACSAEDTSGKLNEISLHICAQALRRITRAQQTMNDVLGRARGTMFWKIAYYTYQAAIAGAYIVFLRPQSKHAESALEDLASLTDYFDRMPDRWNGLRTAKHGLRVLRKLAVAARENPRAASISLRTPTAAQTGNPLGAGPPLSRTTSFMAEPTFSQSSPFPELSISTPMPVMSAGVTGAEPSTPSSSMYANMAAVQSTFLPTLFNSSFLPSSNAGSPGAGLFGLSGHSNGGSLGSNLFATAVSNPSGLSPGGRGMTSTPLALFSNSYDLQESATGGSSKPEFCYDPFISDTAMHANSTRDSSGKERDSPTSGGGTSSANTSSPSSNASAAPNMAPLYTLPTPMSTPFIATSAATTYDPATETDIVGLTTEPNPAALNHKELANYWSEYFSLQLDWDRLSGLS